MNRYRHSSHRRALMDALYARQGGACHWCGKPTVRMARRRKGTPPMNAATIDHLKLHAAGGPSSERNCVMACRRCNERRGSKSVEAWDAILCTEARV